MSALQEPDWDALEEQLDDLERETDAEVQAFDAQLDELELGKGPIPDSIEPIEAWRTWKIEDGKLTSIYSEIEWKPGEPLQAKCDLPAEYRWDISRHGMSLEDAQQMAMRMAASFVSFGSARSMMPPPRPVPSYPRVEPPDGWGYVLTDVSHDHAPEEMCSCGVYAAESWEGCPIGHVLGKVKLWGKVIPGDKGYRAEYAYPSEFRVDNHDHDTLLAQFGVPIVYVNEQEKIGDPADNGLLTFGTTDLWDGVVDPNRRVRRVMIAFAILNLAFATLNIVNAVH